MSLVVKFKEKVEHLGKVVAAWAAPALGDAWGDHEKLRVAVHDALDHSAQAMHELEARVEAVAKGAIPSEIQTVLDGIGEKFETFIKATEARLAGEVSLATDRIAALEAGLKDLERNATQAQQEAKPATTQDSSAEPQP